jgi:UDP-N-acetylmuramoyl-L-alanyl-D-glutamate--2,6-diaminopimelate ligase
MRTSLGAIEARLARDGLLPSGERLNAVHAALPVMDATVDSRAVVPGGLFCAVVGTEGDGHAFLADAVARGAAAALVERPDPSVDVLQLRVSDGRRAAAVAAAEVHRDPWNELTLVGVTGTNGKTTSAAILRHLLSLRGPAGSIGTLGAVGTSGEVIPGTEGLTTPGPVQAAGWLRRFADDDVRRVSIEVSSHALEQDRMAAVRFDAAVFTNLTRDHLDYHGTMEAYRSAKLRLLDLLKDGGAAVFNADDPAWEGVHAPAGRRTVRFGIGGGAEVRAEEVRVGPGGMEFTLATPDGEALVRLPLFGTFNVSNALGCAAALWTLGWSPAELAAALTTVPQVRGRLERVAGPPYAPTTLLDFAHTPDALERALQAVRPLVRGRLLVLFGAGGDRDPGKRPEMGRVAAANADLCILTSDNPRTEDPERILDDVEAGMEGAPRLRVTDRRRAIRRALEEAEGDDVVVLAGKGHETYQIVGTEKRPFDEREVVRDLLAEMKNAAGSGRPA